MFILNPPYVSELLKETIEKNTYFLLKNNTAIEEMGSYNCLLDTCEAVEKIKSNGNFKIYTNSEDAIEWISENLSFTDIPEQISLFKDKIKFRNLIKEIYPDFYFEEITIEEFKKLDGKKLKYPFIFKPAVGFLSFGVYPVNNENDFECVVNTIEKDIENIKGFFPVEVVNTSKFIIEEMIKGDEYAIDAYFNEDGEAVILNIFYHPFLDENDVSDRVYYTSKEIITKYEPIFRKVIQEIGTKAKLKNFPMHIELRMNNNDIIPIEVNPMRFAGWCDTDLAYFAYGINIYEYYMENKKPDWEKILSGKENELYFFTGAEIPNNIDKKRIKAFNYEQYLSNIKNPLEIRITDFRKKPLFAVVFGKTRDIKEIKDLLELNITKYIEI